MISNIFHTAVYQPLYNALIAILSIGTWVDVGIAVIALTLMVKFVLAPLSLKAARTQLLMKELEAPMRELREKYKNDKAEQGKRMLELYKEKGVNPLSGFATLFVQLPVILGLYFVFLNGGLPDIHLGDLYSFVRVPEDVNMYFLGIADMAGKSYVLAALAGITQYLQAKIAFPATGPRKDNASFQEDFARTMQIQMKYLLPVFIVFIAYVASAAVALYWITSNIFMIAQELYVRRILAKDKLKAVSE